LSQAAVPTNLRRSADQRILVVWLERIEDMALFPYGNLKWKSLQLNNHVLLEQLLPATDDGARRFATKLQRSDLHILFIHNFEPGLVRIHVESVWTKTGQTGPLVDGIVISLGALPSLLRQTVANIVRRKAVEVEWVSFTSENFVLLVTYTIFSQPSNSYRRRQSILELSKKFATQVGYTEFLDRFITV
jgi:hypothetical protein